MAVKEGSLAEQREQGDGGAKRRGRSHLQCGWSTQPLEVIREASERAMARKGRSGEGLTVLERAFWEKQERCERMSVASSASKAIAEGSEARRMELWEQRQRNNCDI